MKPSVQPGGAAGGAGNANPSGVALTGRRVRASRLRRVLAHTRRRGDNDGMAGDDSKAPPYRWALMLLLDGRGPSRTLGWVSTVAPVVTQAAAGAGHWAA